MTRAVNTALAGAGGVLQVVSRATVLQTTTTSSSYVASTVTASITPTSATSKILVVMSANMGISGATKTCFGTIFRNEVTNLGGGPYTSMIDMYPGSSDVLYANQSVVYLDSPATTSSTSYTLYFQAYAGTGTANVNPNGSTGSMTLMEIAA